LGEITKVAIIGAGPYGLSIAAHLRALGVDFRIFGSPMHTWLTQMPRGMFLKSEGFATNLSDPQDRFTLARFFKERGIPYRSDLYESGWTPVPLDNFTAYGLAFQKRFVPEVEKRTVVALQRSPDFFTVQFDDATTISARNVILAIGIHHFRHFPTELSHLPSEYLSHSSDHNDLSPFTRRKVAVIGAGSSSSELAALLREAGAEVYLVARGDALDFQPVPNRRASWRRAVRPMSAIGFGWHSLVLSELPMLTHYLPLAARKYLVQRYLQPCGGWFVKDRVVGEIPLLLGCSRLSADIHHDKARLQVEISDGTKTELHVDHVFAATGYLLDLARLPFLSESIQAALRSGGRTPALSSTFQSSVQGLYFIGPMSADSFGPSMRFVHGARYTAHCVTKHIASSILRKSREKDRAYAQAV
jgi:cation diffusion facilitator CzcD-associated flavoprotein CzcO